jgi:hypothetical protein
MRGAIDQEHDAAGTVGDRPQSRIRGLVSALMGLPFVVRTAAVILPSAFCLLPFPVCAQDALRYSVAGSEAAESRARALEGQPYLVDWGPGKLIPTASLRLEATDNVELTEENREADLSIRPEVGVLSIWPLSERNLLTFDLAVGYTMYAGDTRNDQLTIRPGSQVSLDLYLHDFRFNLHNRMHYSLDPLEQGAVSGSAEYGGFYNTLGASAFWHLTELILSTGYDHFWFLSDSDQYDYLSRNTDSVFARATVTRHTALEFGGEAALGMNRYREQVLNDSLNASVGGFVDWKPTAHLSLDFRGGYTAYHFRETGIVGPAPDQSGFYFSLGTRHRINSYLVQELGTGRRIDLGVNADLQDVWSVRYSLSWRFHPKHVLSPRLFYEHGEEQGGLLEERYDRIGFGLELSHRFLPKLEGRLGYGFTAKDSHLEGRDYYQNRVSLTFAYHF